MPNVMSTALGRKWWFVALLSGMSTMLAIPLLRAAGMPSPETWAQWLVTFLCVGAVWRSLEFVAWLALVLIAPGSKLLDPVK